MAVLLLIDVSVAVTVALESTLASSGLLVYIYRKIRSIFLIARVNAIRIARTFNILILLVSLALLPVDLPGILESILLDGFSRLRLFVP